MLLVSLDCCAAEEMASLLSPLDTVLDLGLVVEGGDRVVDVVDVCGEGVCGVKDGGGVAELSPRTDFVLRFDFLFLIAELEKL